MKTPLLSTRSSGSQIRKDALTRLSTPYSVSRHTGVLQHGHRLDKGVYGRSRGLGDHRIAPFTTRSLVVVWCMYVIRGRAWHCNAREYNDLVRPLQSWYCRYHCTHVCSPFVFRVHVYIQRLELHLMSFPCRVAVVAVYSEFLRRQCPAGVYSQGK